MNRTPRFMNTRRLLELCRDSENRTHGPTKAFYEAADPGGVHLCTMSMAHNGPEESRSWWLCKLKERDRPFLLQVDCSRKLLEKNALTLEEFDKLYPTIIPAALLDAAKAAE